VLFGSATPGGRNGAGSGRSYVACGGPWGGAWLHTMLCLCMLAMRPRSGLAVVAGWLVSHALSVLQPSELVSLVSWLVVRCEGGLKLGMDLSLCRLACMCMHCRCMDLFASPRQAAIAVIRRCYVMLCYASALAL
jgi:hypothetical protein